MQILQGGTQQIGGILDRAIQIGRDIANKRTQQEQDLAAMRNQETAMAQRRGENLQSVLETQQKFGMEQDKFDFLKMDTQRKYDAARTDEATRAMEKDAAMQQQQAQFDKSYGLSERRVAVDEATAKRQADEAALERQRLEAAATPPSQVSTTPTNPASSQPFEVAGPVNVLAAPDTTGKTFVSPLGRAMTANGARPFVNAAEGGGKFEKLLAYPTPVSSSATPTSVDPASLKLDIRDAEKGLLAAEKLGDRAKIEGWKTQLKNLYTQEASLTKSDTPAEQRAQERFDWWLKNRDNPKTTGSVLTAPRAQAATAGTALKQTVEGMPDAFQNPYSDVFAPKDETELAKKSRTARAEQWSKNQAEGERQSALSMDRETYANKFYKDGMSADEIKRMVEARRKVWDLAQTEKSAQSTLMGQGGSPTSSPVKSVMGMPTID